MKKTKFRIALPFLLATAIISLPPSTRAQAQDKLTTDKKPPVQTNQPPAAAKKPGAGPFHGKLAAMDKVAKTITVGKRTFQITSETKIRKGDKPATFGDGVVGEECSGYVRPAEDGKLIATTVNFGPKNPGQAKGSEKKDGTSRTDQDTK